MRIDRLSRWAIILVVVVGCSKKGGKDADFVPASDKARTALESALNNWKNGNPSGDVPGTSSPKVVMQDWGWHQERKLQSYEIVKDEGKGIFSVRLTLQDGTPVETRYVVYGIDPLQVIREEDYNTKLTGAGS